MIEGQLSQTSVSPPAANVRVAVVWNTSTTGFKTSVDVPVAPEFPSKFRLELQDTPPTTAMVGPSGEADPTVGNPGVGGRSRPLANGPSNFAYAIGSVVAYEDLDQNHQLGLIDALTPPTDRVLGSNDELLIVYVEGDPLQAGAIFTSTPPPVQGYNLLRRPRCSQGSSAAPPTCPPMTWLPISTPYDLPLTADPQLAELMCRGANGRADAETTTTPAPKPAPGPNGWPAANTEGLNCNADGQSYTLTRCQTSSQGLCKDALQSCTQETWTLPSTPPPAEWPCPIE
ncbi:hypothetical protein AKJ09_05399 [Labilithrix luteola]|uniref:Uncharacterized protein n=1 Tax=Labilithrix luteola TaxID=1391654 RepID=A0A0K1PYY7_9BACT|nr:hypothetical protein AKJ09_05399 [Labilithrix luteola]